MNFLLKYELLCVQISDTFGNQTVFECLKSLLVWISDTCCTQEISEIQMTWQLVGDPNTEL